MFIFFQNLFDSLTKLDIPKKKVCTCHTYNRNTNAFNNDQDNTQQPQQLYPHIRKTYDEETDALEHVHIIMSPIKPENFNNEEQEETVAQRRRRRTRISKQRAKALITEYCTRKNSDTKKSSSNKRNHSSLLFFLISIRKQQRIRLEFQFNIFVSFLKEGKKKKILLTCKQIIF